MTINIEKNKTLWRHGELCMLDFSNLLEGVQLEMEHSFNYLGAVLEAILSFKEQCQKVISFAIIRGQL